MYWLSKSIHKLSRFRRQATIFAAVLGPGIITMVADNDAGGISTYAQTGAKTGFGLLWAFIILVPMAYYVQEMTVRLGAVTKRGHAEAIFDGFGKFWGWFSIFDLALVNWLTLVTEYIGMTQAMRIFGKLMGKSEAASPSSVAAMSRPVPAGRPAAGPPFRSGPRASLRWRDGTCTERARAVPFGSRRSWGREEIVRP